MPARDPQKFTCPEGCGYCRGGDGPCCYLRDYGPKERRPINRNPEGRPIYPLPEKPEW